MRFYAYVAICCALGTAGGGAVGNWDWFSLLMGGGMGAVCGFMIGFAKGADKA